MLLVFRPRVVPGTDMSAQLVSAGESILMAAGLARQEGFAAAGRTWTASWRSCRGTS